MLPLSSIGVLVWLESTLSPWSVCNVLIMMLFISWSGCKCKSSWLPAIVLFSLFLWWGAVFWSHPQTWVCSEGVIVTAFQFPAKMFDFGVCNMQSLDPEQRPGSTGKERPLAGGLEKAAGAISARTKQRQGSGRFCCMHAAVEWNWELITRA